MSSAMSRTLATLPATLPRVVAAQAPRTFTTGLVVQKSATEAVKDGLKSVDRAVSDKLVDGINIGSTVANKVKEAGEDVVQGKATGKAQELRGEASGKASEVAGKASEVAGEAKGTAHEMAGKAKGKAEEVKRKM